MSETGKREREEKVNKTTAKIGSLFFWSVLLCWATREERERKQSLGLKQEGKKGEKMQNSCLDLVENSPVDGSTLVQTDGSEGQVRKKMGASESWQEQFKPITTPRKRSIRLVFSLK